MTTLLILLLQQAFGVSVFEDDDDDIYGTDDMSNYDFSLPTAGEKKKIEKKNDAYANENCIEGFHIATKPPKSKEQFPLPVIPAGMDTDTSKNYFRKLFFFYENLHSL